MADTRDPGLFYWAAKRVRDAGNARGKCPHSGTFVTQSLLLARVAASLPRLPALETRCWETGLRDPLSRLATALPEPRVAPQCPLRLCACESLVRDSAAGSSRWSQRESEWTRKVCFRRGL